MIKSIAFFLLKSLLVYIAFTSITLAYLNAQCYPEAANSCEEAKVFCSLDELNGFTCSTPDFSNPTACLPCNNNQGVPHNSSWWAFVSEGGEVTISIIPNFCDYTSGNGQTYGFQFGIVSQCDCSGQIACKSQCTNSPTSIDVKAMLIPCKTYYIWVDGCDGSICNFTIKTSGGKKPTISQLGNITRSIPNPIYTDCYVEFKVAPPSNNCQPFHVWTIDGEPRWGSENTIRISFPQEGTFSVCVHAVIGNSKSGSLCSPETPTKCISVVVKKKIEARAKPKFICPELIPYKWHCHNIYNSGTYRCPFNFNGCAELDSIIDITVLNKIPQIPERIFIGCDGEIYMDSLRSFHFCNNKSKISYGTKNYRCDSSYILTTLYPTETGSINITCVNNNFLLSAKIKNTTQLCGLKPIVVDSLEWFDSLNPQTIIGNKDSLSVTKFGVYCVRHTINYSLENITKQCRYTYCTDLNLKNFTIKEIIGNNIVENEKTEQYKFTYV